LKYLEARVETVRDITDTVREFYFVSLDGAQLPSYTPGAHISVDVAGVGLRQYSLVHPWENGAGYTVATQREDAGRGGSRWMHEHLVAGAQISITAPRNNFPLVEDASLYLLIAGGIGLTPLLCMAMHLKRTGRNFMLMASARSWNRLPYRDQLQMLETEGYAEIAIDGGDPAKGLDIEGIMGKLPDTTHVYCCGPNPMMDRVLNAPTRLQKSQVHFEAFGAGAVQPEATQAEFDVSVGGKKIRVGTTESILSALGRNGFEVESSCGEGYCGTCLTRYTAGTPIHRDTVMSDEERCRYVAVCTARAQPGSTLVLEL
jgi:vanillate O-demethylase ferredoxin subunit